MTYNLTDLRAELERATPGPWELESCGWRFPEQAEPTEGNEDNEAIVALVNAARAGLLDDAALGRAVRAAAERDGPERRVMAEPIWKRAEVCQDYEITNRGTLAQAAASALIEQEGGK